MTNTISMAERTQDGSKWSVEQMLEEALRMCRAGELGDSCLLLDVDQGEKGDRFIVGQVFAGTLRCSGILALLEIAKIETLKEMNYLPGGDV